MKTVKRVPDKSNGADKAPERENLINALYVLAEAYAELAALAMFKGDRNEVYRCVAAERAAQNKAHKLEKFGHL